MAFKRHHGAEEDGEKMDEGVSRRLFDLLFQFDVVPGMDGNGVFHEETFLSWTNEAIAWSVENDREDVVKNVIGNGLSYFPIDKDQLPPASVMDFLNQKGNKSVRSGYSMGTYNQRGVHFIDPEGKEEMKLAERYREIADAVRGRGYSRFAETLEEIADYYLKEKRWNERDDSDKE